MEKFKIWFKKNGVTAVMIALAGVLLVSPEAKAWVMRVMLSTGLMNSNIEEKPLDDKKPIAGADAIDFRLSDESGKIIELQQLKGKVVFINFWASWCPPCRAEMPSVQKFYEKYKDNNQLAFLIINLDDNPKTGERFLARKNYTLPFLIPASNIPPTIFQGSLPTTVILDKQGKIRLSHAGMADYSSDDFYQQLDQLLAE